MRRPPSLPTAIVVTALLFLTPLVSAHGWRPQIQYGYSNANLMLQDCNDDWGVNHGFLDGHDLGGLYVKEGEINGESAVYFNLGFAGGYATSGGNGPRKTDIAMATPRIATTVSLRTNDNSAFQVTATNGVAPVWVSGPEQWLIDNAPDNAGRFGVQFAIPHSQLKVANGESITGLGGVSFVGESTRADVLPGGSYTPATGTYNPSCSSNTTSTPPADRYFADGDGWQVSGSSWTPPPPPPPNAAPVADFTIRADTLRTNETLTFVDMSTDDGTLVSWSWTFGDGVAATTRNASHAYSSPGTYDVRLQVADAAGLTHATTVPITIIQGPIAPRANFTASTPQRAGTPVHFNDTSIPGSGPILNWTWTLGDGTTRWSQNLLHSYAQAGTYPVTLAVRAVDGPTASIQRNVTIAAPPTMQANFTISAGPLVAGADIAFAANASGDAPIAAYNWSFGDGSHATTRNATHSYATPGNYTVTLRLTDTNGINATASRGIVISASAPAMPGQLVAAFIALVESKPAHQAEAGAPIVFEDKTQSTSIRSRRWDFGDGAVLEGVATPTHVYAAPGNYTVVLTVVTSDGTVANATQTITVRPANIVPTAAFTIPETAGVGESVVPIDGSNDPDGSIISRLWDFGDGTRASTGAHAYERPGAYTLTLTVSDDRGATATSFQDIRILAPLVIASISPASGLIEPGATIPFLDVSTAQGTTITARTWDFGDGQTSTASNPRHAYAAAGTYTVTLTVRSASGLEDRATITIDVRDAAPAVAPAEPASTPAPSIATAEPEPAQGQPADTNDVPSIGAWAAIGMLLVASRLRKAR